MEIKVFKFGGASVKNSDAIKNVVDIINSYQDSRILIVVSAMGKMTNALEDVYNSYLKNQNQKLLDVFGKLIKDHLKEVQKLGLDDKKLISTFEEFILDNEKSIHSKEEKNARFIYDQIVSIGELFSSAILQAYIEKNTHNSVWLDVRDVLKTDSTHREAKVNFELTSKHVNEKTKALFEEHKFLITQGFIASDTQGMTTTLGREGSDYTAAILAYCLNAKELTIWKDVPGILTADPRRFDNVEKLSRLSYSEAIEMTYYGAKVIHPKTIRPIQNKNIRLNVKSFINPKGKGTVITSDGLLNYPPIVVIQDDMMLLQIFTKDFTFIAEDHLSLIFAKLNEHRIKLSTMRNSAISFTICIKNPGEKVLQQFANDLGDNFSFDIFRDLQLITVRYFQDSLINSLTKNKIVLFEETMKYTIQLVVKPSLQLIEK